MSKTKATKATPAPVATPAAHECSHMTTCGGKPENGESTFRAILSDIDKLKASEEALRTSEARYLSIIEDQNELICRYLPDGRLSFVNGAYARYYGKSRSELINRNFVPEIPEPDFSTVRACLAGITPQQPVVAFTHRIMDAAGEIRWQRWTQRGIYAADGVLQEYQAVGFDITESKLAGMIMQARLRIIEYQFGHSLDELLTKVLDEAELLTGSHIGLFHFLDADQVTLTLQSWSSRTLSTACTAQGKGHSYPLDQAGVWCDCIRERRSVVHNSYESIPLRKGLPPGHAPVMRELVVPIFRNNLIVAVLGVGNKSSDYTNQDIETVRQLANLAWDIVERKQSEIRLKQACDELESKVAERTSALALANEEMKKVSFELVWAEERERERIAAELHDRVGQTLLLAKMKLDSLTARLSPDSLHDCAQEACALVEASIQDIRSLTFRMRPPILDTAGIETALKWLCSSLGKDYSLRVDFSSDNRPRPLSAEARYSLYQAVRELLLNVVKHAGTDKASLALRSEDRTLAVLVTDRGIGFNQAEAVEKHVNNGGYGLYNVRQRIRQMGGSLTIDSSPGSGTSIRLVVPFADDI
ncbi:MAG: GAF domain-containing protein [Geobacteraceae bacterium]|nr:GAF domain-containing protein [Geobacteraceae bacterium]